MNEATKVCPHICDRWECRHYGKHEEGLGCSFNCNVGKFREGNCVAAGDEEDIS